MTSNEIAALATHCRTLLNNSGVKANSKAGSTITHAFFSGALCLNFERTGNMSPRVSIALMCGRHMELLDVQPANETAQ